LLVELSGFDRFFLKNITNVISMKIGIFYRLYYADKYVFKADINRFGFITAPWQFRKIDGLLLPYKKSNTYKIRN